MNVLFPIDSIFSGLHYMSFISAFHTLKQRIPHQKKKKTSPNTKDALTEKRWQPHTILKINTPKIEDDLIKHSFTTFVKEDF